MQNTIKFPEDLGKLIDLLRKKGVTSFKYQGLEIDLSAEAPASNYKKKQEDTSKDEIVTENVYSDEDALYWSSAGIPDIQPENN